VRGKYLDYIKVIAIIGVIMIHVCSTFIYRFEPSYATYVAVFTIEWFIRIAVPLFFMCSSAIFLVYKNGIDIKRLYKKNIFKLVICLILYSFVYSAYHNRELFSEGLSGIIHYVKITLYGILTNGIDPLLWFLYAIICIYIMLPIFRVIVDNASRRIMIYFIMICVLTSILQMFINLPEVQFLAEWTDNLKYLWLFTGYCAYVLWGGYVAKYHISKRNRIKIYVVGLLSLFGLFFAKYQFENAYIRGDYNISDYLSPFTIIYASSVFVFFKYIFESKKLEKFVNMSQRYITKLAGMTLGIYLVHILVYMILKPALEVIENGILEIVVSTIVVFLISVIIVYIIKKIPFVGKWIV